MPEPFDDNATMLPSHQAPPATPPRGWFDRLRWPIFFLLIGGSIATGYYALPRQPTEHDRIGLIPDKAQQDFGKIGQGEILQVDFNLTNKYAVPVEIKEVITSCSCQHPSISQKLLAPGEKSVITVKWATGTRRGQVVDPITVIHTLPGQAEGVLGQFTLQMVAEIEPDIRMEPVSVAFDHNQPGVQRVKLSPGRRPSFTVSQLYANSESVTATWNPAAAEIEIRYEPRGERDLGGGIQVSVNTDSLNQQVLWIPVGIRPKP